MILPSATCVMLMPGQLDRAAARGEGAECWSRGRALKWAFPGEFHDPAFRGQHSHTRHCALASRGGHAADFESEHFNWRRFPRLYDEVGEDLGLAHEINKSCSSNNFLRGE